jgi:hypothetical protein
MLLLLQLHQEAVLRVSIACQVSNNSGPRWGHVGDSRDEQVMQTDASIMSAVAAVALS